MKATLQLIVIFIAVVLFVLLMVYTSRFMSAQVTPINLVSPKQGVTCATMVTSDGAAISCWKD